MKETEKGMEHIGDDSGKDPEGCPQCSGSNPDRVRASMPKLKPAERMHSFDEVELGLDSDSAVQEAIRCLGCCAGLCVGCRICAEVCPEACIKIAVEKTGSGKKYVTRYDINASTCLFCGLCTEACPTGTLTHSKEYELSTFNKEDMYYHVKNLLSGKSESGREKKE
jgi:formate hydrogenlyase subunit 6/NADH:ubiquinone oxidoreductase subunit I